MQEIKIFTIEEAAETLKTRPTTIKSLIKEGKLSAKKSAVVGYSQRRI